MSYDNWKTTDPRDAEARKCPTCDGEGVIEEEHESSGDIETHKCGTCGGCGEVTK